MTDHIEKFFALRPMDHFDLLTVLAWRNHPEVRRYMFNQNEISMDEHESWFESVNRDPKKRLLILEADNKARGYVAFTNIKSGGIADWGFYVAPDAPKGTGRQLGRTALEYAFTGLNLHKVCGQALGANERSIRFHQTLGFHEEAVQRDQHFDGERYHNVICFGLLSSEWQRHK